MTRVLRNVDLFNVRARRSVARLRLIRRSHGPQASAAAAWKLTAPEVRAALALALATEEWSREGKAAVWPGAAA